MPPLHIDGLRSLSAQTSGLARSEVQLLGVTALSIASKLEVRHTVTPCVRCAVSSATNACLFAFGVASLGTLRL